MLPGSKKYKKAVAWSCDFGMDQYVLRCLPADELNLDTIWSKYEDLASLKQMKCEQDLTYLQAFAKAVDQWMSGTMLHKFKCVLLNTHKKLQTSCIMTSFGFLER